MTAFFAPVLGELGPHKLLVVSLLDSSLHLGSAVAPLLDPRPALDAELTHQVVLLGLPLKVTAVSHFTGRINVGGRPGIRCRTG